MMSFEFLVQKEEEAFGGTPNTRAGGGDRGRSRSPFPKAMGQVIK
jgi:hypothetical protein